MTDLEYLDQAEAALQAIELACDRLGDETEADLDNQRVGGMVTITFVDASQLVINLQKPLQEIWVAAKRGGYHFKWSGAQWLDTKGAGELFALLSDFASEQARQPLRIAGPTGRGA